ncbi:S-layer homology domain-containing protein [Cohnella lupini]|uniref:Putative glycosyl hydrolase n=1 Tax=Cohnella lupini TaxID=1294267 RepID=A0A3D9ITU8_9BACL|nr:S-layer homology domain-containing protein [Cohnella lupini]RED65077.1 putative glycosyl hydrolase [Cohnella lupini]
MLRLSRKLIIKLTLILTLLLPVSSINATGLFKDIGGHQAESTIVWAVNQQLVKGYNDGTFRPNNEVTEAEFLAMLLRLYTNSMERVSNYTLNISNWTEPYYATGLFFNMPLEGLTQPAQRSLPITRGKVAEIVAGTFGYNYDTDGSIAFLFDRGLSNGRTGKTIKGYEAAKNLTRSEAVLFLKLLFDYLPTKELKVRMQNRIYNESVLKYLESEKLFYGTNGHLSQGGAYRLSSFETQLSQLKDLGITVYRNDVWDGTTASQLAVMADFFAGSGVQIFPVLTPNAQARSDENDAYQKGFELGQAVAKALAGKVKYYEVGNEMENSVIITGQDGVKPKDYDNAKFLKARGSIRGMIEGIKSEDSTSKIIITSTSWLHFAFIDMLWNGSQPDGTIGDKTVRWDITSYHWYSDMKDITNACGGSGCYNVLLELKQRFGKPIWLTEYGVRPQVGNDEQVAQYLIGDRMLGQYVALAKEYGIQSVVQYSLYDDKKYGGDGNYGLIKDDGITKKAGYRTMKSFIESNPM